MMDTSPKIPEEQELSTEIQGSSSDQAPTKLTTQLFRRSHAVWALVMLVI